MNNVAQLADGMLKVGYLKIQNNQRGLKIKP